MNIKFGDVVLRVLFIFAFVLGTVSIPNTNVSAQDPNFTFGARPYEERVEGWGWPLGETVIIEIDDPATGESPDFTGQVMPDVASWHPNGTWFDLNFTGQYDLKPDDSVTVTQGSIIKTHTVTNLTVTDMNMGTDTISGTAEVGSFVETGLCYDDACVNRNELVDQNGNWSANFGIPGDEEGEQTTYDLRPNKHGDASQWDEDHDGTMVGWSLPNPTFGARPYEERVEGWGWPLGETVIIEIDDPATGESPDFTGQVMPDVASWHPNGTWFDLNFTGQYDLKPDDSVTVTQGSIIKTHTVTNLTVTDMNMGTDTISGTAEVGSFVETGLCYDDACVNRNELVDQNGNWSANFGIPGDEEGEQTTYDLRPNKHGDASQWDEDHDGTMVGWSLPNPTFGARPYEERVEGWGWPLGETVNIQIDDPLTLENPDFTGQTTPGPAIGNPNDTWFNLDFSGQYDLKPGDFVTVTQGVITKTHMVTNLTITDMNMETDTISGTAEVGSFVDSWICYQDSCVKRIELVDQNGNWLANFGVPGNEDWEQTTYDIRPNTRGDSVQWDEDMDATAIGWSPPNPYFQVRVNGDNIQVMNWPMGAELTLTIDDPATTNDYTSPEPVTVTQTTPWGSGETFVFFDINEVFDIQAGFVVSMSDGTTTRTYTVTNLSFTNVDLDTDIVSGIASPGVDVQVWASDGSGSSYQQNTTADATTGEWQVDFTGIHDIVPGTRIDSVENDGNGNSTMYGIAIPNPYFQVRVNGDSVDAMNWLMGAELTLTIDDPATTNDYTSPEPITVTQTTGSGETYVRFDINEVFDIQAGFVVSVSDGTTTRTHTISNLSFTNVDLDTDIISGIASPGADVRVWICDGSDCNYRQNATADATTGEWQADFTGIYDIVPGTWIESIENDINRNGTLYGITISNPWTIIAGGLPGPLNMDFDAAGNLYVANDGNGSPADYISKITPDGTISTFSAGYNGVGGLAFDSNGVLFAFDYSNVFRLDEFGNASVFIDLSADDWPHTIAFDAQDNLYVTSNGANHYGSVSKFAPDGTLIETYPAYSEGWLLEIVVDDVQGKIYLSDDSGFLYQIDMDTGSNSLYGQTANANNLNGFAGGNQGGLTRDGEGNLYMPEIYNGLVYRIDAGTQQATVCLRGLDHPLGLAFGPSGRLYVSEYTEYDTGRILSVDGCTETPAPPSERIPSFTSCSDVTQIPQAECEMLVAFYNSTNGANWIINTDWLQTDRPFTWPGVTCWPRCDLNNVRSLFLGYNGLTGSIPSELSDLTQLTNLQLHENDLTGSIPPELGNLTLLTDLMLGGNSLTGSIPPELGNLTQLTNLELPRNSLTGSIPPELGNLTLLTELRLANNQLSGNIPPELGDLTNLTLLYLNGNQLSGPIPPELGSLTSLTDLRLQNNKLTGEIPAELGNLTSLTNLRLGTNQLTGGIPTQITNLSNLQILKLQGNQLTGNLPSDIGNLTNLTELTIDSNQLSGEIPSSITNLTGLTILTLSCGLNSTDPNVIAFLDQKSPGWQQKLCLNTPIGNNVSVPLEPWLTIQFDSVTQEGFTTVQANTDPVNTPNGFQVVGNIYEVSTGSQFTQAQVCFTYDDTNLTPNDENQLKLYHEENSVWVDVTDSGYPNVTANLLCGTVTSFSPFAILYPLNQPPVADAGGPYTADWSATLTLDGSGSTDPDNNIVTYEWDLDNDGDYDDSTGLTTITSFTQNGDHTIGLRVTDDGGLSDTDTATVTVLPWTLKGFYQPVDMNGVYNLVKGGSTVPLKFEIFAGSTELTDVADIRSLTSAETTCNANAVTDEIELTATGGTSLRYADGQFIYNWKTPKNAGKCYRVTMTTIDGSSLMAYFKLK